MAKGNKSAKSEGRTLSAAESVLFDKLMAREKEKEERAEVARKAAARMEANKASRPDYEDVDHKELWEALIPGTFVSIWSPQHGVKDGLMVRDFKQTFKKGVDAGKVKNIQKHVFVPEGVVENENSPEDLTYLVIVFEGEIVSVGSQLKMPKNIG